MTNLYICPIVDFGVSLASKKRYDVPHKTVILFSGYPLMKRRVQKSYFRYLTST